MQPALHQINKQSISSSEAAARWTHVTAPDVAVGGQVRATAAGNMPELTQHLWLGKVDAQAAATTPGPQAAQEPDRGLQPAVGGCVARGAIASPPRAPQMPPLPVTCGLPHGGWPVLLHIA